MGTFRTLHQSTWKRCNARMCCATYVPVGCMRCTAHLIHEDFNAPTDASPKCILRFQPSFCNHCWFRPRHAFPAQFVTALPTLSFLLVSCLCACLLCREAAYLGSVCLRRYGVRLSCRAGPVLFRCAGSGQLHWCAGQYHIVWWKFLSSFKVCIWKEPGLKDDWFFNTGIALDRLLLRLALFALRGKEITVH